MTLFKELNENQETEFRRWARDNYEPLTPIEGIWHPVIQDECAKINSAHDLLLGYPETEPERVKIRFVGGQPVAEDKAKADKVWPAGPREDVADSETEIRDKLESFGVPVGDVEPLEERIQCPWCHQGWIEKTPPEYKDPEAVVYCPDCSSVFKLVPLPEVSP
jgi:hypothetical protein